MIIGLTGGIASGKSLVAEQFRELGVPVIDTDIIARQVVAPGHPVWRGVREVFGPDYFLPDGELDRDAMGRRVFADPGARRLLESLTHPAIFAEVDRQVAELGASPSPPSLIVVVVPLLFEVGAEDRFDLIVAVQATPRQQRERLLRARGCTPGQADARLAAQSPLAEKVLRANIVIDNTGAPEEARRQVVALVRRLRGQGAPAAASDRRRRRPDAPAGSQPGNGC